MAFPRLLLKGKIVNKTPTPDMTEAMEAEAPPAPQEPTPPSVTADQIAEVIAAASEDVKEKIRIRLDLNKTHARAKRNKFNNQQVRNTVKAFGEVTHTPDFIPDPPSRIKDRGPEATTIWQNRWLEGNGNNLSEFDLDQISSEASM